MHTINLPQGFDWGCNTRLSACRGCDPARRETRGFPTIANTGNTDTRESGFSPSYPPALTPALSQHSYLSQQQCSSTQLLTQTAQSWKLPKGRQRKARAPFPPVFSQLGAWYQVLQYEQRAGLQPWTCQGAQPWVLMAAEGVVGLSGTSTINSFCNDNNHHHQYPAPVT